jgi:hypothetical protein
MHEEVTRLLRDALGRIVAIREAIAEGAIDYAADLASDLEADLAGGVAQLEERARAA